MVGGGTWRREEWRVLWPAEQLDALVDVVEELRGILSRPRQDGRGATGMSVHELGQVVDLHPVFSIRGVPNIRGTLLGVPNNFFGGIHGGPPILRNYHKVAVISPLLVRM